MDLREQLRRHRKDSRLILGGLTLLLIFLTFIFYLLQRSRELPSDLVTNRVLLFVLWYIDVVLILAVLFVLLRNLLKVAVERRHRILGSKFKTKLVATYIGLSLIPVLLLFAIATELLQGSVERWFSTPLSETLKQGYAVVEGLNTQIESTNLRDASRVLREVQILNLEDPGQRAHLARRLGDLLAELQLDFLAVFKETDFIHAVVNTQAGMTDLPEPGRSFLQEVATHGQAVRVLKPADLDGRLILAAVAQAAEDEPPTLVVAGTVLGHDLAKQSEALVQAYQGHRQLEVEKESLSASQVLLFLMVTLVILLNSSWVGLYLARRVTVPIQALAEGTRRVAQGDLTHQVAVKADDELGVLVDSFNSMTQELKRNEELLERSNEELIATNRRLAEERALLAAVLHNVAAGVVSLDHEGTIFTCNGAALRMLRQREEEVVGKPAKEVWSDPERSKILRVLDKAAGAPSYSTREVHLVLGGEWKTFEVKITTMYDPNGGINGQIMVLEDLTELIKAQKLAAWTEVARRIAHEIKNPLTPIRLAAERIRKKHEEGDPELGRTLDEGVETIVREVSAMQAMVDEFSRYARMPHPQPSETDLTKLVDETLQLYRGLKAGIEIRGRVDEAVAKVWLDGEQLKRALINLLDNAVEATEPPGSIELAAQQDNGFLQIHIADSGRGIAPENKEKLFLPYFSTKGRGTGLGLAIVHRIVSDHHGIIRVEDNHPNGTVFTIELPLG